MKRFMRILLVTLLIVAIGGGGYFYYQSRAADSTSTTSETTYTQVVQVTQGDLNATLSVVGQLEAVQSTSLAFEQMNGTTDLLTLAVQAGNTVTEGQVLATIADAPYQQSLDQAESDLQAAEEALADLQAPATALDVAQADMTLAQAQQTLEQATANLAELSNPDLADLRNAVQDAQDNITLLEIEDRSVKEIAQLTGWSVPLVKVRAFRARAQMKKILETLTREKYL